MSADARLADHADVVYIIVANITDVAGGSRCKVPTSPRPPPATLAAVAAGLLAIIAGVVDRFGPDEVLDMARRLGLATAVAVVESEG